jgi:hypothetical protein
MMVMSTLYWTNTLSWIFVCASSLKQQSVGRQIYLPGLIFNTYSQNSDIVFVQEHKSVVVILELRSNGKVWLARNQDNESEWNNMSTYGLSFSTVNQFFVDININTTLLNYNS